MKIESLRKKIDRIDEGIIRLLSSRMILTRKLKKVKERLHIPIVDLKRERIIHKRIKGIANAYNLDSLFIKQVFDIIITHSKKIQNDI